MKRPAFQFYPNDWTSCPELRACSMAARGLWIEMICIMHQGTPYGSLTLHKKDILPPVLARMTGITEQEIVDLLAELEQAQVFGRNGGGTIISRRMLRDERVRRARARGGVKSLTHPNVQQPKGKQGYPSDHPSSENKDILSAKSRVSPSSSSSSSSSSAIFNKDCEAFNAVLIEESPNPVMNALLEVCGIDLAQSSAKSREKISWAYQYVTETESDQGPQEIALLLQAFGTWHFEISWPGKVPWPDRIREKWGEFKLWKTNGLIKKDTRPANWSNQTPEERQIATEHVERMNARRIKQV